MALTHLELAARLGVCSATLTRWRLNNYFGDVPKLPTHPPTFQYDWEVVKAAIMERKLHVSPDAFTALKD